MINSDTLTAIERRCYAENRAPTLAEWRSVTAELDEMRDLAAGMRDERDDYAERYIDRKRAGDRLADALDELTDCTELGGDDVEDGTRRCITRAVIALDDWRAL